MIFLEANAGRHGAVSITAALLQRRCNRHELCQARPTINTTYDGSTASTQIRRRLPGS